MLEFGNPDYKTVKSMQNSIRLEKWIGLGRLDSLLELPPPGAQESKRELLHLVDLMEMVTPKRLRYLQYIHGNLYGAMSKFLAHRNILVPGKDIKEIVTAYNPIIEYLKVHYNRPRPYQLAGMLDIPLYPLVTGDQANSAAYPSGHTFQSLVFAHIFGKRYPELKNDLMKFVLEVKLSREEAGVHYPSDGHFAFVVYKKLRQYL
jgi:hypothetical protein